MRLLLVVVCCVGCAASKQSASAGAPPPVSPQMTMASPRDEITRLDQEIRDAMGKDQLAVHEVEPMAATPQPLALTDPQCHPAKSDTCNASCDLSSSICKNADRICELAQQLAGDDWAAGRCKSARQSCADANKKCCTCML